jgi:single-strand DNA-binding protein
MNETNVTMIGNVASDLRHRRTAEGTRVVSFRMASTERRFDPETGRWVDGRQIFVTVNCWRRLSEGVVASLGKGDPVVVTGRMYTRDYEYEGQQRVSLDVDAQAVGPDLARCTAELRRHRPQGDGAARDAPAPDVRHAAPAPDGRQAAGTSPGGRQAADSASDALCVAPPAATSASGSAADRPESGRPAAGGPADGDATAGAGGGPGGSAADTAVSAAAGTAGRRRRVPVAGG